MITLVVLGSGALVGAQWNQTMLLRTQRDLMQMEASDLTQLKAENQRLRAKQISAKALEALRADHAALPRLRAEIEALNREPAKP